MTDEQRKSSKIKSMLVVLVCLFTQVKYLNDVYTGFGSPSPEVDKSWLWAWLANEVIITLPVWLATLIVFKKTPSFNWSWLIYGGMYLSLIVPLLAQVSERKLMLAIGAPIPGVMVAGIITPIIWTYRDYIRQIQRSIWFNE